MTNSRHPTTFSCWKIRFKTQVSACSGSPSEAMLWVKEVEMADSVVDLKSWRSFQGCTHFPNFEMLDDRIASALNKSIQNSYFKQKVSLKEQKAQKEDRFFSFCHVHVFLFLSLCLCVFCVRLIVSLPFVSPGNLFFVEVQF